MHSPKFLMPKLVDVHAGPFPERAGHILLMIQQRNMAQMIERQFTHRAAARTVSGMAAVLAHEIKNPLSGIRGAAQLLEPALSDNGRIILTTKFRPGVRLSVPGSNSRVSLPLLIQVEDNGNGVAEHLRPHLFDPFVTTKHNGTGLGLALVAKIIGDHGGIIEYDSEPRRTVFRVLLPLQERKRGEDQNPGE